MRLKTGKIALATFVGLLLAVVSISAQDPRLQQYAKEKIEKSRRNRAALETTANASPAARIIAQQFSAATTEAEIERIVASVVQTNDRSVIPYLKARLAADYSEGRAEIEVALVKLGEEQYVGKAVAETNSVDSMVRSIAVWKLARFGTREAYRKLYELLDDELDRNKDTITDSMVLTMSWIVKEELSRTINDLPEGADKSATATWKNWFESHPELLK